MSSTEVAIYKLRLEGATDAVLEHVRALGEQLAAMQAAHAEMERWAALGDTWAERVLTPFERFQRQLEELDTLLAKGLLSLEQYERAVRMIREELDRTTAAETALVRERTRPGTFGTGSLAHVAIGGVSGADTERQRELAML